MEIYPVVHINDIETAKEQGGMALELGADGVYLIDHNGTRRNAIFETMRAIRHDRPDSFVGVNLLGYTVNEAYKIAKSYAGRGEKDLVPNAIWADNVEHNHDDPDAFLEAKNRSPLTRDIKLLGGIAFKYTQTFTENPEMAYNEVKRLWNAVDVVTTSGEGTGKAPSVEKLRAVKNAAGDKPVAVASGISAENIAEYAGLIDQVLVSSSVETRPYSGIFDKDKLRKIIEAAHMLK